MIGAAAFALAAAARSAPWPGKTVPKFFRRAPAIEPAPREAGAVRKHDASGTLAKGPDERPVAQASCGAGLGKHSHIFA